MLLVFTDAMSSGEDEGAPSSAQSLSAAASVDEEDEQKAESATQKKKTKKGRVKFDISLPAQHLVSSSDVKYKNTYCVWKLYELFMM